MPFAAALSTAATTDRALEEVCAKTRSQLSDKPDLAAAFFSAHHAAAADRIARTVAGRLGPRVLLGCVAEAVIGDDREVEDGPALSLWLGRFAGGVAPEPFHAVLERTSEGSSLLGLPDRAYASKVPQISVDLAHGTSVFTCLRHSSGHKMTPPMATPQKQDTDICMSISDNALSLQYQYLSRGAFFEVLSISPWFSMTSWCVRPGLPDGLVGAGAADSAVILLGDPYTFPADRFLDQMNENNPGLPVLGGMASGVRGPGECRMLFNGEVRTEGAVGVLLQGQVGLRSIVSQGCRPIGRHMVITRAEENLILELGGKPPLEQLQELWQGLDPQDQNLLQQGLHIGRVINEYRGDFQRGDFLVRNVIGIDRNSGALAITERVRVGQTVQFHVRDAQTADEDLHALLQLDMSAHEKRPAAALVFSCNGRGSRLFDRPDHDALALRAEAGDIPAAGFFAQGELGPVGGQNFLHGFTASLALFEE